eukprot:179578-Alexandrium_andersonii.AAC.1
MAAHFNRQLRGSRFEMSASWQLVAHTLRCLHHGTSAAWQQVASAPMPRADIEAEATITAHAKIAAVDTER